MITTDDLTPVQRQKLFSRPQCEGFWPGSRGFAHKRTIYTVDNTGAIWTHTATRDAKYATWADIRKLFK